MASTTYGHFVDTNKMYAAQEQFRDITKMVCCWKMRGARYSRDLQKFSEKVSVNRE